MRRGTVVALYIILTSSFVVGAEPPDLRSAAKLLKSRDAEERVRAVGQMSKLACKPSLLFLLDSIRDEDARVRARARAGLGCRRSSEDLALVASRGVRHGHPAVRLACCRHLAAARFPDLAASLERALSDSDPGVREAAAGLFASHVAGRSPQPLAAAVLRGREGRPRASALLALSALDEAAARTLCGKLLRDPEYEVRVVAAEILAQGVPEVALDPLTEALDDPCWSVRLTAARGLAGLRLAGAVEPLIDALEKARGRMVEEVGEALARLTGVGLSPEPKRWRVWWEKERDSFLPSEVPAPAPEASDESVATFHSIPFRSDGVAFVLDRSRSMRHRLERGDEKTKGQLVEEGLRKTLARLGPQTRFFLVAFATEPKPFTPRPIPAGPAARHRAAEWFEKQRPTGRTNLYDSIALALEQEVVDTIFLLTDGAPSAGEYQTRSAILEEVKRLNRYRKAVIHTVEVGEDRTGKRWRGFLADLAAMTGGHHAKR